jgi:hypothetical protein
MHMIKESRFPRQLLLHCPTTVHPWTYAPACGSSDSARNTHPAAGWTIITLVFALLLALLAPVTVAAHTFTPVGVTNGLEARIVP